VSKTTSFCEKHKFEKGKLELSRQFVESEFALASEKYHKAKKAVEYDIRQLYNFSD
jgi:hypothetical protein